MTERLHDRVPFCVRVQFRNASSFLVAYTVNLSRGGVFLETDEPVPLGSAVTLQVEVPQAGPVLLSGRVSWRRDLADVDGPAGIGVEFDDMVDSLGTLIDRLVTQFAGITVLLVCRSSKDRSTLTRQLRSIIATAEVVGASDPRVAGELLDEEIDLLVVDAESCGELAMDVLQTAQSLFSPVPSIALASDPEQREQARQSGADELVSRLPSFSELQSAVMRALGRPSAVRTDGG